MKKVLFSRTTIFIVFALAAVALMGATISKTAGSDLHQTAGIFAKESSAALESIAINQPGAILRANIIE